MKEVDYEEYMVKNIKADNKTSLNTPKAGNLPGRGLDHKETGNKREG